MSASWCVTTAANIESVQRITAFKLATMIIFIFLFLKGHNQIWNIYKNLQKTKQFRTFSYFLQMCDWIESHFLTEQVEAIKELGDHIANLKRVGTGLGEYMFDKETLDD